MEETMAELIYAAILHARDASGWEGLEGVTAAVLADGSIHVIKGNTTHVIQITTIEKAA